MVNAVKALNTNTCGCGCVFYPDLKAAQSHTEGSGWAFSFWDIERGVLSVQWHALVEKKISWVKKCLVLRCTAGM